MRDKMSLAMKLTINGVDREVEASPDMPLLWVLCDGAAGLPCVTCYGESNPPESYGPHAPPGALHWGLPSPAHKMAWIGLSPRALCEMIKDKQRNGGRDFPALITHVSEDKLVAWGWNPGGDRTPVSVPRDVFLAKFKEWAAAGGPCPYD